MPDARNTSAGTRNHFMFFVDDDGVILGSSPTRPSPGTGSGAIRLWAAKRAAATVPNPDVVIAEGDDGEIITEYEFASIASRGFIAEIAVQNLVPVGQLQNTPVRQIGRGQFVVVDRQSSPVYNVGCILQGRAVDVPSGANQWSGVVISKATARYLGRNEFNERTPAVYRFFITPQAASITPLGYSLLDNDNAPVSAFYDEFKGYPNPITIHAFTGNGSLAIIPVDYAPINALPGSVVSVNTPPSGAGGTSTPVTSVTQTKPFAITLTSAPAQAVRNATLYEFIPSL